MPDQSSALTQLSPDTMTVITTVLHQADTWIAFSFLLCIALFLRYALPLVGKGLDGRAEKIRDQLEQANRLHAEAEALLLSYQQKQNEALAEAEAMIASAKADAASMRSQAAHDLQQAIAQRSQQAQDKIARTEAEAVAQIRAQIIELATEYARAQLADAATHSDEHAVTQAVAAISQKIH